MKKILQLTLCLCVSCLFAPPVYAQVISGYSGQSIYNRTATIVSGQSASTIVDLKGFSLTGILLPGAFTGTSLIFLMSANGTNFFNVYVTTSGTALSYTVSAAHYYAIDPVAFYGIRYLKIVSGSTEAADRVLTLSLKGI